MKTFTAGQFEVCVAAGSPAWITVRTQDLNGKPVEFRFHPEAMPDLKHVLHRADVAARVESVTPEWAR